MNNKFGVQITWLTKKVKTLFRVKDKSQRQACKIYNLFAHVVKVISVKLSEMFSYVEMSKIIR